MSSSDGGGARWLKYSDAGVAALAEETFSDEAEREAVQHELMRRREKQRAAAPAADAEVRAPARALRAAIARAPRACV